MTVLAGGGRKINQRNVFFVQLPETSNLQDRIIASEKILKRSGIEKIIDNKDKVAVKVHVGERENDTHVAPEIVKVVVSKIKKEGGLPFLTETSTLYKGERSNAIDHLVHAFSHGFTYENTGAPFIMADGLSGNTEIEITVEALIFKKVNVAREIVFADVLVAVSHPTGHPQVVLGACLKNLGMGLSSRIGKLRQHSSIKPYIDAIRCTFCKKCIRWCPVEAIIEKDEKAFVIQEKCIGCGECIASCNFDAVKYNWGTGSAELQKRVAEHALGVMEGKKDKAFFLNFLFDMTKGCDCFGTKQNRIIPDVGILASNDPVAVDQATLDLTREKFGESLAEKSEPDLDASIQLEHAERIGLGSSRYRLTAL
ncbi:Ion-translocating oxidoreductase complex subunit B [subsurface metagenome]